MKLRRDRRRLPGTLCDETPQPVIDRARCRQCDGPLKLVKTMSHGFQWWHCEPVADGHAPLLVEPPVAEEEPVPTVAELRRALEVERARRVATEHQLVEVTTDRDVLERANGRLISRQRTYRSILADLGVAEPTIAALEAADQTWNERDVDVDQVWPA